MLVQQFDRCCASILISAVFLSLVHKCPGVLVGVCILPQLDSFSKNMCLQKELSPFHSSADVRPRMFLYMRAYVHASNRVHISISALFCYRY